MNFCYRCMYSCRLPPVAPRCRNPTNSCNAWYCLTSDTSRSFCPRPVFYLCRKSVPERPLNHRRIAYRNTLDSSSVPESLQVHSRCPSPIKSSFPCSFSIVKGIYDRWGNSISTPSEKLVCSATHSKQTAFFAVSTPHPAMADRWAIRSRIKSYVPEWSGVFRLTVHVVHPCIRVCMSLVPLAFVKHTADRSKSDFSDWRTV